jgi:predicted O-methyltransferase YrrM
MRNVLEVGTAIGHSTSAPRRAARLRASGTLEIDPGRARRARDFWDRAGVADRIELVE